MDKRLRIEEGYELISIMDLCDAIRRGELIELQFSDRGHPAADSERGLRQLPSGALIAARRVKSRGPAEIIGLPAAEKIIADLADNGYQIVRLP